MYGGGGMDLFSSYGRAGQGPPKYGQLPAIPPVYRADQLLSALQIPRAYREPAFAFAIVDSYIASKKARGHAPWYIGSKLELLEAKIPMTFAGVFIDAREWHRIPPSRVIRRREPTGSSLGRTNTNASASSSRLQRPVSASAVPSVTQMAAMDRRPPVNRPPARQQSAGAGAGDEPPPPPYSAEDPEPEATRALQESLAAAAAEQDEIELPEPDQPQHRRANSSSASMMTAQTSLSNSDRRTSGDRPIPGDFPASPAARAGSILSNGPSSSTPAAASSSEVPGGDAPPVDTSNMDEEERRAVEESQLEEAMRASRQAEKERLEYEAAVQASLAQAEEDALRRALQYPGESAAESSGTSGTHNHRERSRSGSEEREPRSGRSSKRSSLHAPSVSSNSSGATVRRTGSFNTNKPLPNPTPSALPPVQEPANKSLMDMLASIDFNAPEIKPIQPQPALAAQRTGGSRGSFSGASGASIEATVSSPQSSSTSWLGTSAASGVGGASAISGVSGSVMSGMSNASGGTATATHSTAPTPMGTTPTQPSYIHHAEPRMKSKNPFLSAEEEDGHDTPTAVLSPGLPPRPPARSPPAPPRSEISDAAQNSYQYHNHSQHGHPEHQYGQYLDPSTAEFDHSHSGSSSPSYSPNWRGDAHGLTINTSPRSGFAPSLSSAGATVAGMTPSTGSHSPSGFPFPVAVPSGIPPDPSRPVSDISPARNLPPIPASRSAESLPQPPPVPPAPNHHAQPPPLPPHPPLPARPPQSANHTPSASFSSRTPSHTSAHSAPSIRSVHSVHSEGPATLDLLKGYDTVFLVDDGALRGEGWEAATHLLASLVESAPEGLDVCFLNSKRIGKTLKERADVEELFAGLMPRDGRSMGLRLDGILGEYIDRLEREGAGIRKLNLIVVTDGGFAKPVLARAKHARGIADLRHELLSSAAADDAESVLVSAGKRLDRGDFPPSQVGVQFVQIGDDVEARKALLELDGISTIHAVRDMVDTVRYRPDAGAVGPELAAKILLGGIHRGVDAMP